MYNAHATGARSLAPIRITDVSAADAAADTGANRTDTALERVREWHAKVVRWLTIAAVGVTLLLGWIGPGQLSLLAHGLRRGSPP